MQINRKELIGHLSKLLSGVELGETILEGVDTFLFTEKGIYSYKDSMSVCVPVNTGITGALKAKDFHNLLQKLEGSELEVSQTEEKLSLTCEGTKASLKFVQSSVLAYVDSLNVLEADWQPLEPTFIESLKLISLNNNNSTYRGVCVQGNFMLSTDEIRICKVSLQQSYEPYWLDSPSIVELLKVKSKLKDISIIEGWTHYRSETGAVYSCRTNDYRQYPSTPILNTLDSVERKQGDVGGGVPDNFHEVIDRVSVLSSDFQGFAVVNLNFTTGKIKITSSKKTGEISEELQLLPPIEIEEPIQTAGDAGFLVEASKKADSFYVTKDSHNQYIIVFIADNFTLLMNTIKNEQDWIF